ncbi:MAG: multidrug transporter [Tannerella sp.]|jgi:tetratricopeptide (TPR) repeat protein|nr:multidrug transporter [Tannerella sp.]
MKGIKDILQRYSIVENKGIEMYFDADEIVDLLDYFEEMNDFDHFEKVLALGQKLHPENPDIKIRICRSYIYHEEYEKALELIDRFGDQEDLEVNLLRMECLCCLDHYEEVIAFVDAQQAQQSEALEEIFEYLAPVLNEPEKHEEAYNFIRRGLALFPENLILKEEYCYYLEMQGLPQLALPICKELIDANPYAIDYWYMQGRFYLLLGDYDKAVDAFDFALACDDSDMEVKILKAYCLFMNEHYEKAIEVYLDLLSGENNMDEHIQPLLAECYMKSDHYEQAYTIFKELLENTDIAKGLALYKNYIHCCLETEREKEATDLLPEVAAHFPEDLLLLSLQAVVHIAKGEQEEAVCIIMQILDLLYHIQSKKGDLQIMIKSLRYLGQNLKQVIDEIHRVIGLGLEAPYRPVHQAIKHLLNGDMEKFCRKYGVCSSESISGYLNRIFSVIRGVSQATHPKTDFLFANEIRPEAVECITSEKLSSHYLTNKHHYN